MDPFLGIGPRSVWVFKLPSPWRGNWVVTSRHFVRMPEKDIAVVRARHGSCAMQPGYTVQHFEASVFVENFTLVHL
jgi:hypothetical protein